MLRNGKCTQKGFVVHQEKFIFLRLNNQQCDKRDISSCACYRLRRINGAHRSLVGPIIIFYCSDDGYNFTVYSVDPATDVPSRNKKISAMQFCNYSIQPNATLQFAVKLYVSKYMFTIILVI